MIIIAIIIITIIITIIIHLFNVEYNTDSYNKNYNMAKKFLQNPRRHLYCFHCKLALRSFTFNNGAILPYVKYGAAVKLEVSYIGEVPGANLTLASICLLLPRVMFAIVDLFSKR